ncbi:uncharacterized protein [Spinacia oleracea]|uniref:Signal peptidase complex catalytic subunit SEC11 n=1 Tax=Spinacia oleracea TaxID=3562 RepID=A0ABM3QYA0_SPIOL|nr:uncharacterized protein LOC110794116 [Spinacia oleracea]
MVISSAFMAWKFITCLYGSEPPLTIIVADSMGPGLQKGDILLVTMDLSPIQCGDVIMFHIKEGSVPVVHRVIQITKRRDTGEVHLLTKGDNSPEDDRSGVYTNNQLWLNPKDHVIGRVIGSRCKFCQIHSGVYGGDF